LNSPTDRDRLSFFTLRFHVEIEPGDRILLCTDGLSDMVAAALIAEVLDCQPEPQSACDRLIERALDAGGADNITVVLCDVSAADETRPQECSPKDRM
jgi:protein phosphatase